MNKTYKLALRITDADLRKLLAYAGPHGSVSSVVRLFIAQGLKGKVPCTQPPTRRTP